MKSKINIINSVVLTISLLVYFYLIFIGRNQYIYYMSYIKCILFVLLISLFTFIYVIVDNKEKIKYILFFVTLCILIIYIVLLLLKLF